jgi:hypothetical protein
MPVLAIAYIRLDANNDARLAHHIFEWFSSGKTPLLFAAHPPLAALPCLRVVGPLARRPDEVCVRVGVDAAV